MTASQNDLTDVTNLTDIGWKRGFMNLLSAELSSWWKSNRWLKHSIAWLSGINLVMLIANLQGAGDESSFLFVIFLGIWPVIGAIVVANGIIVGEKKSGTAEWILSKPITRKSFISAKYISALFGLLITSIVFPSIVAYFQINSVADSPFPIDRLILMSVVACVNVMVYFTFTFMMGTFFSEYGSVLGAGFGFMLVFLTLLPLIPGSENFSPSRLIVPQGRADSLALSIFAGEVSGISDFIPLLWAILYILIFGIISVIQFERSEI